MNTGLKEARSDFVLFLDDDIVPDSGLVRAHRRAHETTGGAGIAGMVLQPGEQPGISDSVLPRGVGLRRDLDFRFTVPTDCEVWNVMAGNLSVNREKALACGGFDENFVGVAYRFETEFCRRLRRQGGKVVYEPAAVIRHLKAPSGGTRTWGSHLTSMRPEHSVGDYYFALVEGRGVETWTYVAKRFLTECFSSFHRTHPWHIPRKMVGEIRGLGLALRLVRKRKRAA
jgi:GT2 family glycosyltransferase